jgi:predicted RNase H-like HicB family nuclease
MRVLGFSAVAFRDGKSYSSWSPDLDIASQGKTIEEAIANLKEAIELHLECLSKEEMAEIKARQGTRMVSTVEVSAPA